MNEKTELECVEGTACMMNPFPYMESSCTGICTRGTSSWSVCEPGDPMLRRYGDSGSHYAVGQP